MCNVVHHVLVNLNLVGFHIYSGTQCLKPDAIVENYEIFLDIFEAACDQHDIVPDKLVLGSGIGIPYHDGDNSVDIEAVASGILPRLETFKRRDRFAHAQLLLETGRYLIGEAGYYLVRVVNRKESRGAHICVCDGGMNHHLGACGHLGMVLHRPYRIYKIASSRPDSAPEPFDLYGPLCTSIDHLGRNVQLPGLHIGDVIAVACSGAYGASASPINFISHDPPAELMVETRERRVSVSEVSGTTPAISQNRPPQTRWARTDWTFQEETHVSRREKLIKFMRENIDHEFDPDEDSLIDLMDSVSLLQLVVFIEQDLDIRLDMSMMGLESFANIDALLDTLDEYVLEHVGVA